MLKPLSANTYLGQKNAWMRRALGLEDFSKQRDISQIEREYNLDKYARLMPHVGLGMEGCKALEFEQGGLKADSPMPISFGDELFEASLHTARTLFYGMIKATVARYASTNTCELGCGYGYNLSYLPGNGYGGEYAQNAVQLGQALGYDVRAFNYYEVADYAFIRPDTTVVTVHSVEQIPDATAILEGLRSQKSNINYVVHFEPTVLEERSSLLGLVRNKYMELNDYNRNLRTLLLAADDIEVLETDLEVFGLNPLNTANLFVWRFKA